MNVYPAFDQRLCDEEMSVAVMEVALAAHHCEVPAFRKVQKPLDALQIGRAVRHSLVVGTLLSGVVEIPISRTSSEEVAKIGVMKSGCLQVVLEQLPVELCSPLAIGLAADVDDEGDPVLLE